jgi:formate-dependent nitrite reductase membrane component NrfD
MDVSTDQPPADRESRLDRLREDAAQLGPLTQPIAGYYGRPVLKPAIWTWEVPAYLFIGGAAGICAVIAWVAAFSGDAALARDARHIAATGAALSPLLLISDLGRPGRFLNMLRVFKPQSPMSMGAWLVAVFCTAEISSAAGHLVGSLDRSAIVAVCDAVAALSGLLLATYPGVLMGATAIPVWNRFARVLPWHFAASSLGAAASALELVGNRAPALNVLGITAAIAVTALALLTDFRRDPVSRPLVSGRSGMMSLLGDMFSGPLPLVLRFGGHLWLPARLAAAAFAVIGSCLTRFAWVAAGRQSAQDPELVLGVGSR